MNNFYKTLINQLAKESRFVTDNGELKGNIIYHYAWL